MKDYTGAVFNFLAFIIAIPLTLFGLVVNIYSGFIFYHQMHYWLKFGKLIDTSIYACLIPNEWSGKGPLYYIPKSWSETWVSEWLLKPNDWIGLHKIIVSIFQMIPIYVLGILIGTIIMLLGSVIIESIERSKFYK